MFGIESYVIIAKRYDEEGFITIDDRSGGELCLMSQFYNAGIFSYDSAVKYHNMLLKDRYKKMGFKDPKIYRITLDPIDYTYYGEDINAWDD